MKIKQNRPCSYYFLFLVLFLFQNCNPVKSSEENDTKPVAEFFALGDFEDKKRKSDTDITPSFFKDVTIKITTNFMVTLSS